MWINRRIKDWRREAAWINVGLRIGRLPLILHPGPTCPRQSPAASCTWCGTCFACARKSPCSGAHTAPQSSEAELFNDDDVEKGFAAPGEDC